MTHNQTAIDWNKNIQVIIKCKLKAKAGEFIAESVARDQRMKSKRRYSRSARIDPVPRETFLNPRLFREEEPRGRDARAGSRVRFVSQLSHEEVGVEFERALSR